MFPGQLDHHLAVHSREELRSYDIFSGHFSWALLDVLGKDTEFFTVLRDPVDRIISFYAYLRRQGQSLPEADLHASHNRGLKAAATLSFEEFLCASEPETQAYIRNFFENFYMFYFGTRMNDGRALVRSNHDSSDYFVLETIMQNAIRNLESIKVYSMNDLMQVQNDLSKLEGFRMAPLGDANSSGRERTNLSGLLPEICNDVARAREQINLCCEFDMTIYRMFFG
jgi:hypothetical protein